MIQFHCRPGSNHFDPQNSAVLSDHPHLTSHRRVGAHHHPYTVAHLDLAAPADDGVMHHKGFANEFRASHVQPRLVGLAQHAALAPPPVQRGQNREHGEQQKLQLPTHGWNDVSKNADAGSRHAYPQQITACAEHLQDKQHGAEPQPVPERQVLQVVPHGSDSLAGFGPALVEGALVEGCLDDLANAADGADHLARFQRHENHFAVVGRGQLAQRVDVLLRNEIIDGLHVASGNRFGHHLRRAGLGFGLPFAGFGFQERRLTLALGFKNLCLFLALGSEDRRGAKAFGLENLRAFDPFGFHLAGHGRHQISRRADVLDLDAGDLDAPRRGGFIDDAQQTLVDPVALAEHGVQLHGAEHGTNVSLQQVADRMLQVVDLVSRLGAIDHLVEAYGVYLHGGIVRGDDFLGRDIQHGFHHVDPVADAVHDRHDDIQPGFEGVGVAAETLHGPLITLGHDLEAHEHDGNGQRDEKQNHTTDLHNQSLLMIAGEK